MNDLRDLFNSTTETESYQRVDNTHPLDLYVGVDEYLRWTFLLVCEARPHQLSSSGMILARIGYRQDERWTVSLSLMKEEYQDMFILLCGDIIESSRMIRNKRKGVKFIVKRYNEWKDMLANSRKGLLSPEEIKGLLGEMYFLDSELIKRYGSEKSVMSWTGPRAVHQDFVIDDTWYEVKTLSSNKDEVKISSVEQLDSNQEGKLIVVFADKTSRTNVNALNLNVLYMKILTQILDDDVKAEFCNMLFQYGYYLRPEYEDIEYTFEIKGLQHYLVTETFPCFRRRNIPANITKVSYYISLSAIEVYREET
ncbi:PD-(D/E)XK motif protein [Clostridium sp. AF18-27]|uniref:PD-(D/E)XK motif protein n=1 Tax=Enterocloster lavalensis TaxID=460384 RepID=UPI000E4A7422|nr:PD-(D/E)XK motif protein [Enterocloster lavalensis]RHR56390.1 PD-(D/E)XK motif protein [Clostridium sp. AF18-27]